MKLGPFERIVILTGAGVSAESGLGTFRDKDGLWTKYDLEEVATPEGFARNPEFVLEFYNARRQNLLQSEPNPAHFALGKLDRDYPGQVTLVTQNVDTLHEQGGSGNVVHMHGELLRTKCNACGASETDTGELQIERACAACGVTRALRPDVVWFGEIPYHMERIQGALARADLFISIGTSGQVYPAAGFVQFARSVGAHTVELNLEPSEGNHLFAEHHTGPASEVVPAYVERLLLGV